MQNNSLNLYPMVFVHLVPVAASDLLLGTLAPSAAAQISDNGTKSNFSLDNYKM